MKQMRATHGVILRDLLTCAITRAMVGSWKFLERGTGPDGSFPHKARVAGNLARSFRLSTADWNLSPVLKQARLDNRNSNGSI